jgi:hypothetical protein
MNERIKKMDQNLPDDEDVRSNRLTTVTFLSVTIRTAMRKTSKTFNSILFSSATVQLFKILSVYDCNICSGCNNLILIHSCSCSI